MPRLAIYDVMGIQDFVFNSNELKDNIGASNIIYQILMIDLPEIIKEHTTYYVTEWRESKEFRIPKDDKLEAEIIYIGGGNAMVAYKNGEIERKVTKAFSRLVFEKSFSLNIAMASIETPFDSYINDKKELLCELDNIKNSYHKTTPLIGISITKLDTQTGLPITNENAQDSLTTESYLKRHDELQDYEKNKLIINNDRFKLSNVFDKLGRQEGDSRIAVVHIDGNNMGNQIDKALQNEISYEKAVMKIRKISVEIDKIYKDALNKTVNILEDNMDMLEDKLKIYKEDNKSILPFRNIIQNGDDITFVCQSNIAISITEKLLREINKCKIEEFDENLSACAGIAIVNAHFPFSKAYEIAEECCSSAKAKAKFPRYSETGIHSWLDFQIVHNGITTDVDNFRTRTYQVQGMKDPTINLNGEYQLKQYNLLWRPYVIIDDTDYYPEHNIDSIKSVYKDFLQKTSESEVWPRSRMKKLRDAFMQGTTSVKSFLLEAETRKYKLPTIKGLAINNDGFSNDNRTPYFDVLEIMDMYIELEEGIKDEN